MSAAIQEMGFQERRRVVVTGMGTVSPLGTTMPESFKNLINNESGIAPFDRYGKKIPYTGITYAGQVPGFDPVIDLNGIVSRKELLKFSPIVLYALKASWEALLDAGVLNDSNMVDANIIDPTRIGTRIGTGYGGAYHSAVVDEKLRNGRFPGPFDMFQTFLERASTVPSMKFGLKGPLETPTVACATGNYAITGGVDAIVRNKADMMLVGGTEAPLNHLGITLFEGSKALSSNPDYKTASRPLDKGRDGFVISEGAASLVLEEMGHAMRRNALIYAEVVEYGNTADAYHDTAPSEKGEGSQRAMRIAFDMPFGYSIEEENWSINGHLTSTPRGDEAEVTGTLNALPEGQLHRFPLSGTKSATGHMLGAAGAFEGGVAILSVVNDVVPGTITLRDPIAESDGFYLPVRSERIKLRGAISNSFGFGGPNSSIVFARPKDIFIQDYLRKGTLFNDAI